MLVDKLKGSLMSHPYFSLAPPPVIAILTATTDVSMWSQGRQSLYGVVTSHKRPFLTVVRVTEQHRVKEIDFLRCGHKQFRGVVTRSQPNLSGHNCDPSMAVNMVLMGVTTLRWLEPLHITLIFIKR